MVAAICEEIAMRKDELQGSVSTIYFGGGTPSLLSAAELEQIFSAIHSNYTVANDPEITLEANPDDLVSNTGDTDKIFLDLKQTGINRLSIGVQSFFEKDLQLMNRAHNNIEALECVEEAHKHFKNFSIDLIYGIPGMTNKRWIKNIETALELNVPHLSCYALTVEPRTALKKFIDTGKIAPVEEEVAREHYEILLEMTEKAGYINYEFSNFCKPGFQSQNNTAYWTGRYYLGIGPSAHGYDGKNRSWNVANNTKYIKSIEAGQLPSESETLSKRDRYNEYIMTALRTDRGVSLRNVEEDFGIEYLEYLMEQAFKPLREGDLILEDKILHIARKARFLGDGIASNLFCV